MPEKLVSFNRDEATEALKVPPHSLEAEQSVLGGLMLENEAWDKIADRVSEADFYRRDHRLIFRAITSLAERGAPFDVVTLGEWLEKNNQLDEVGGMPTLAVLAREGVQVVLGGETGDPALSECALVATHYGDAAAPLGAVGVIGPIRMDYSRVIPLVGYCSRVVTEKLLT